MCVPFNERHMALEFDPFESTKMKKMCDVSPIKNWHVDHSSTSPSLLATPWWLQAVIPSSTTPGCKKLPSTLGGRGVRSCDDTSPPTTHTHTKDNFATPAFRTSCLVEKGKTTLAWPSQARKRGRNQEEKRREILFTWRRERRDNSRKEKVTHAPRRKSSVTATTQYSHDLKLLGLWGIPLEGILISHVDLNPFIPFTFLFLCLIGDHTILD